MGLAKQTGGLQCKKGKSATHKKQGKKKSSSSFPCLSFSLLQPARSKLCVCVCVVCLSARRFLLAQIIHHQADHLPFLLHLRIHACQQRTATCLAPFTLTSQRAALASPLLVAWTRQQKMVRRVLFSFSQAPSSHAHSINPHKHALLLLLFLVEQEKPPLLCVAFMRAVLHAKPGSRLETNSSLQTTNPL